MSYARFLTILAENLKQVCSILDNLFKTMNVCEQDKLIRVKGAFNFFVMGGYMQMPFISETVQCVMRLTCE